MKRERIMKRVLSLALSGCLMLGAAVPAFADGMEEELKAGFRRHVTELIQTQSECSNMYDDAVWSSRAAAFPAAYDLREHGYVPDVRDQESWGTCWGFASIAASEISILSELGMTTGQFAETYGKEMDLSEKHLAWFATGYLPEDTEDIGNQNGEGIYLTDESAAAHYENGGTMGFASTIFSAGMGPVWEAIAPYRAADGSSSTAADWSLPEDLRFMFSFELENSSILPSPAIRDENGGYLYSKMGTEAIKQELLAGRAVTISYHADQAMDPEAQVRKAVDQLKALGFPDDAISTFIGFMERGGMNAESITPEETEVVAIYLVMTETGMSYEEARELADESAAYFAEQEELTPEEEAEMARAAAEEKVRAAAEAEEERIAAEAAARSVAEKLGIDYDAFLENIEQVSSADEGVYINTDTYAQYTDNVKASVTHAVCIVGWDDDYDVSNFPADHQPPANGAWIVRNSWGSDYGNEGYFYLSYYDQTITAPETFDYLAEGINSNISGVDIRAYDMMEAQSVDSIRMDEPTFTANVFTIGESRVLNSVSIMTAAMDTGATVSVYLLNADAQSPVDGTMLDTVTASYQFGGYHRVDLHQNYLIPAGSRISIVQLQRTGNKEDRHYTVPFTCATTKAFMELWNQLDTREDHQSAMWEAAVVNEGESFIMLDGTWQDWAGVLADIYAEGGMFDCLTYDNFGLKAYLYPAEDLNAEHSFGQTVPYCGMRARICEDCGYTIVEQ